MSPGADALLTLIGGERMLGGISGALVRETTDENPERVAAVQRMSTAYLRNALQAGDSAWERACDELPEVVGRVNVKGR